MIIFRSIEYDGTVGGTQDFNVPVIISWVEAEPIEGQYKAPLPSVEFVYLSNVYLNHNPLRMYSIHFLLLIKMFLQF